ncbi:hypothetical protein [Streptacidiphilus sp. PAMC 29251]
MPADRPTRACPHRWCRRTHTALAATGAVFLAEILFHGLASILFTGLLAVVSLAVYSMVHGKSPMEGALDDLPLAGINLVVRPGWARAAVGCDLFYAATGLFGVVLLPMPSQHGTTVPTADTAGFVALVVTVALTAFTQYAHRQATRPAKPKRVLVPALSSTI